MSPLARKRAIVAGLLILFGIATWYLAQPRVPAGQAPMVTLDDGSVSSLRDTFNRDAEHVRIMILQSPT
jgi:hypothetical protein